MAVNVKLISVLRERTGAGMMDCKKALEASDNDIEKACDWLRENGIAKAAKKSGRIAAEGTSKYAVVGNVASLIEVNCETDFVCANAEFKDLVNKIAVAVATNKPSDMDAANALVVDGQTIADLVVAATAKIGEKISFRRFAVLEKTDADTFGCYLHMGGKKGSVVVVKGQNDEVAQNMAMQVVATVPQYITKAEVPSSYIEHELQIRVDAAAAQGRPLTNPKALEGMKNKIAEEVSLESQEFILEDKKKVGTYLQENQSAVLNMVYYIVGEGIEKRNDDFAAEVMAQINK